ncbi:Os07g0525100 [Oryza sativa Japonica Group]|uniref:Os07g0525100 protein n=1 Tax=Oryza sativa subsp. japonica TaxID=39947 RepID=Q0D5Y4_ORYSJ|nr:Os07g0525100 [Oryza sativa Japonica Group]|eukprot:NP_001059825.2 Os07g0525100 [Oryza sativa Japonica Group]
MMLSFQGPLIEDTSKLMNTTLQICCASVQAFVVAVAAERDFSKWKLGWNVELGAVIYSVIELLMQNFSSSNCVTQIMLN